MTEIPKFSVPQQTLRIFNVLAWIGAATVFLGTLVAPQRMWANLLLVAMFIICIGLAGMLFITIHYISGGGWWVVFRRVPEALAGTLIPAGILLALVVIPGVAMYAWNNMAFELETQWFKEMWLTKPFFIIRTIAYIVIWVLFSRAIISNSRKQDKDGSVELTTRNRRLSAAYVPAFAITFSLASFDWIMSLEPEWFSTMFGVYNFAGLFLSGIAVITMVVIWLKRVGPLKNVVNKSHMHDLGSLMFGFSCFWGYIWFCQYMLIWYANLPEESFYFVARMQGQWLPLFILNMVLNWVIPFLALMPRFAKHNDSWVLKVCIVVLIGRWLDLYLMVLPSSAGATPVFGLWEIGAVLGGIGIFGLMLARALSQAPLVPAKDPYFEESLHHHR